jgi:DNA-binding transcriptional regulator YhcF (GntR family)
MNPISAKPNEISEHSKIPKYQQIIELIKSDIDKGILSMGAKIPSISEMSEELYLSRNTVEHAYKALCYEGVISSVCGKGYYVERQPGKKVKRILLLFNKLSEHKKTLYNSFVKKLGDGYDVDLQIHNSNAQTLLNILIENIYRYDHYVIMPHLIEETEAVRNALNLVPKEKLLLVNKDVAGIEGSYSCVYEDFELDIHQALYTGMDRINKYKKIVLIFPTENYYCSGIKKGFINFCEAEGFKYEIIDSAIKHKVRKHELYIVIEETDLVETIKNIFTKNMKLGKDVGIIAYNETPFKEILAGGISVLSTNFSKMGETMVEMLHSPIKTKVKNPFMLTMRNSL